MLDLENRCKQQLYPYFSKAISPRSAWECTKFLWIFDLKITKIFAHDSLLWNIEKPINKHAAHKLLPIRPFQFIYNIKWNLRALLIRANSESENVKNNSLSFCFPLYSLLSMSLFFSFSHLICFATVRRKKVFFFFLCN